MLNFAINKYLFLRDLDICEIRIARNYLVPSYLLFLEGCIFQSLLSLMSSKSKSGDDGEEGGDEGHEVGAGKDAGLVLEIGGD